MQINPLSDLLKAVKVHHVAPPRNLPEPRRTPPPERNKVITPLGRDPVNRAAARILYPSRSWIDLPPPEDPAKPVSKSQLDRLKALLKSEYNAHAHTRDSLGFANQRIRKLSAERAALLKEIARLTGKISEQDSVIRQLEDLKL